MVNRRVLCLYAGERTRLWHERLLLGKIEGPGCQWVICTPDADIYIEDFDGEDFADVRVVPIAGGRPSGLVGTIYPFLTVPTAALRAKWTKEAKSVADAHDKEVAAAAAAKARAENNAVVAVPKVARRVSVKAAPAADAPEAGEQDGTVLEPGHLAEAPERAGHRWYSIDLERDGPVEPGTDLTGLYSSCLVFGGRGTFVFDDGRQVLGACKKVTASEAEASRLVRAAEFLEDLKKGVKWTKEVKTPPAAEPALDARLLEVREDARGRRHRDWASGALAAEPVEIANFAVDGPRSAKWVLDFVARVSPAGAESYHRWWRTVTKLTMADWGVPEHAQLCRYLDLAVMYDQVDASNLASLEAIVRRLQLIEFQYRERSREALRGGSHAGAASSSLTGLAVMQGEEAALFDGEGKTDTSVCVCPQLVEWISGELEKTAKIDKAARKAREEKALARGSADLSSPPLLATGHDDTPKGPGKGNKKK